MGAECIMSRLTYSFTLQHQAQMEKCHQQSLVAFSSKKLFCPVDFSRERRM